MTYKVLLVDDESLILRSLQKIIDWKALGCEIAGTANDGQDAALLVQDIQPDIVITDICMPEMNGLDLLKRIQTMPVKPEVILLSGYNEFEYAREGLQNNAFDYILKPIDHEELEECINRVITKFEELRKKEYEHRKHLIYEAITLGETKLSLENDDRTYVISALEFNKGSANDEQQLRDWVKFVSAEQISEVFLYKFESTRYILVCSHLKKNKGLAAKVKLAMQEFGNKIDGLVKIAVGKDVVGMNNLSQSYQQTWKLLDSASFLKMNLISEDHIKSEYQSKYSPDAAIKKAKTYLQENFTKEIGIDSVAEEVDLSVSYFSVLFKQKTGVTFLEYVTNLRIEHACVLLKTTDLKTYEIANMVGYNDQRYFSQVFKKRQKVTPSQYRKSD
ncbi:response regulator transcription factor [Halalkalibacter alkaliphilus]|uniref:Response regulator n=1 Tax=Halalkalibacter alkaliphilus TaxID=2917993 RepID=A0A9X2A2U2_9BACI|nr:response regulator [Halalkalibacter alkaliphilus]MCL7745697.1 response regulator [Halalkalibacter alkaliphilus]